MSGRLLFAGPTLVAAVAIPGEVVVAMAVGEVLAAVALVVEELLAAAVALVVEEPFLFLGLVVAGLVTTPPQHQPSPVVPVPLLQLGMRVRHQQHVVTMSMGRNNQR